MKKSCLLFFSILVILGLAACSSDKENEIIPNFDLSAFEGLYLGNLVQNGNSEVNSEIKVKAIPNDNKLVLKFSDLPKTTRSDVEDQLILVVDVTSAENNKCEFEVKNATFAGLSEVNVEGSINNKVLTIEGTAKDLDKNPVKLSYEGGKDKERVVLLSDFVKEYTSNSYLTVVDTTNPFEATKVVVETTDKANELSFVVSNLKLDDEAIEYAFKLTASIEDKACVIAEQTVEVEGLTDAKISGKISADKELIFELTAKNSKEADVKLEFGVKKEAVEVEKEIAAFDFEDWETLGKDSNSLFSPSRKYTLPKSIAPFIWKSGDVGFNQVKPNKMTVAKSIDQEDINGGAARISTLKTNEVANSIGVSFAPAITAGSLFIGDFKTDRSKPLNSTKFGVIVGQNIVKVTGLYTYKAGEEYYQSSADSYQEAVLDPTQTDKFSISAVMYEVGEESETLTGYDINSSDKIISKAYLSGGDQLTPTEFVLELKLVEGKIYDSSKKYKFAFVASSSYKGDEFSGAHNSTLILDDVKFFGEKVEYK